MSVGTLKTQHGKVPNLKGSGLKKWLNQFRGEHLNRDTQWLLRFNSRSESHLVNQHGMEWRDALYNIPQIICNAVWMGRDQHKKYGMVGADGKVEKIKWQHRFYVPIEINGEMFVMKIRADENLHSKNIYDIKGVKIKKPTTLKGSKTPAASFHGNMAEFMELVKRAFPHDVLNLHPASS